MAATEKEGFTTGWYDEQLRVSLTAELGGDWRTATETVEELRAGEKTFAGTLAVAGAEQSVDTPHGFDNAATATQAIGMIAL